MKKIKTSILSYYWGTTHFKRHLNYLTVAFILHILSASGSYAQTFTIPPPGIVANSAAVTGPGCYNLTPSPGCGPFMQGCMWCNTKMDFTKPFMVTWDGRVDRTCASGADGFVLAFGQNLTTGTGPNGTGEMMGYYGAGGPFTPQYNNQSFGIEFDHYQNGPPDIDIANDHTAIALNAAFGATIAGPAAINGAIGIEDNNTRTYRVFWDPLTQMMYVYCGIAPCNLILSKNFNFAGIFPAPNNVTWGYTGATASDASNHFLCNITTAIPQTIENDVVCQPGILLNGPAGYTNYSWSTGSTSATYFASATGTYTCTAYTGCNVVQRIYNVTVNPLPTITGTPSVCVGGTTALSGSPGPGVWSSSVPAVASVNSAGVVSGLATGITTISYKITATGCIQTVNVTVFQIAPITGTLTVCPGLTTTLHDVAPGGTWSSTNGAVGTIGLTTGIVTGVSPGTTTISYIQPAGCYVTAVVTVMQLPAAITGPSSLCQNGSITLNDLTTGGTWSTGSALVTVGSLSGIVTGTNTAGGTATVTYTGPNGCYVTKLLTVNPVGPITSISHICVGFTDSLHNSVTGGTWTSSVPGYATIGLTTGVITGVGATGTTVITYTTPAGCKATKVITADAVPSGILPTHIACLGEYTNIYSLYPDVAYFSSSDTTVATVGPGPGAALVYGVSVGTAVISYTTPTGCATTAVFTVNPMPGMVMGGFVCIGSTATVTDTPPGGIWTSSDGSLATIGSTSGIITPVSAGTVWITYTLAGCHKQAAWNVFALPGPITGTPKVCLGDSVALTEPFSGGTWSSLAGGIATVSVTGMVHGIGLGTATIQYTGTMPCGTFTRSIVVTVMPVPAAITGLHTVCVNDAIIVSSSTTGGFWSGSNPLVADVSPLTVYGISAGTVMVSYTLANGCRALFPVTVNPIPSPIIGTPMVCTGKDITLMDTTIGGTWSNVTTSVATVGSTTGIVHGVSAGMDWITYKLTATGCLTFVMLTVNPSPAPITGPMAVCQGATIPLSDISSGGTWQSASLPVATIGSTTGIVTGVSPGTSMISYTTMPGGCFDTAIVTVNPLPATITGTFNVCIGLTRTLTDVTTGGTWSSSNGTIATVGSLTGIVTGISEGTILITYKLPTGCLTVHTFTVNPNPDPIAGNDFVFCQGTSLHLHDGTDFGTWSSSVPAVGTIDPFGNITGLSGGTTMVTYMLATGCYVTQILTVNPLPVVVPITAPDPLCVGTSGAVTDTSGAGSGIWDVSNPSVLGLTYTFGGGVSISGLTVGTSLLSYSVTNACGTTTVTKLIHVLDAPVVAPITGILGVCSGFTDTLHDITPGGIWTSSNPLWASIDPLSGVVSGLVSGSVTISYTVTNFCGIKTQTVNVLVNMEPYITSNFIVACQTLFNIKGGTVISGGTECVMVCDSSTVRYYANGVAGSDFHWYVAGGDIVADYGDSLDVFWHTVGLIGSITLQDSFSHCIDSAKACIKVIDKPHAEFWTMSSHYCKNDNILFYDLSTGDPSSPLVAYHWNFGDATGNSTEGTAEHSYTAAGTYTVTLTVKNACNCTDSFRLKLTIDDKPGPDIKCPSIACDSELVTYSTTASCPVFDWHVTGGTIISGIGTASVQILWDNVDSTGFGSVSLATPGCPICSDPTTIKVPVIISHPKIEGLKTICADAEYTYELPLWPATDYRWGVLDSASAIVGCHTDHTVGVRFHTAGTYVIHGWYQNRIKLCGGNAFYTITVVPASAIVGAPKVCADPAVIQTYSVSGGYLADWRLKSYTGALLYSAAGTNFNYNFGTPGTYMLCATGDFCADSFTITVVPLPQAVDSITGEDTVCLGRNYTYKAWNDVPGTIYNWQAIGGTVSPSSGSSEVTVTWTSSTTRQLIVRHVSRSYPYCEGPPAVFSPYEDVVALNITGDNTPCANAYRNYNSHFKRGESYTWSIMPDSVGSVVNSNHLDTMRVLWNNVSMITTANIIVKVNKCDVISYDTLTVSVQPSIPITISASASPQCPNVPVVFTAPIGGSAYSWNFGDGTPIVTTVGNTSPGHAFPTNTTTGNVTYLVHVDVLPDPLAVCPVAGIGSFNMVIRPGPDAFLTAANGGTVCPPETPNVIASVTSNVGVLTYQWYQGNVAIIGATNSIYAYADTHSYHFTVLAGNGCSDTSNIVNITRACPNIGDCGEIHATHSYFCNTLTFNATDGTSIVWGVGTDPDVLPVGWTSGMIAANPITATYERPGIYLFFAYGVLPGCAHASGHFTDTIGIVPKFRYQVRCAPGLLDSVFLADYSETLPFYGMDSVRWFMDGGYIGTGLNVVCTMAAGTTHSIDHYVYGTKPGGTYLCSDSRNLTMPTRPVSSFTFATAPICESVPINFTPVPGFVGYNWNFGDSSFSLLPITQRAFTWSGPGPTLEPFHVILTVTDSIGCKSDTLQDVSIYRNDLAGFMGAGGAICPESIPYPIDFINVGSSVPVAYLWSMDTSTFIPTKNIYHTGSYWVTVTDAHSCQFTPLPAENIKVMKAPSASIFGVQHYCIGDEVQLYGYEGDGVSYQWFRDDTLRGLDKELHDPNRPVGVYAYKLVVTVMDSTTFETCSDTSDVDMIRVYALPAPPTITGPTVINCDNYQLQLTASEPVSGTYNWSNGVATAVNNIDVGGIYRAWFTDLHGCTSSKDINVPMSPDYYFGYFPKGCYNLCHEQLPLTLYGPPCVNFVSSGWLMGGTPVAVGPGAMMPYAIASDGTYSWVINNGLCTKTSPEMDVTTVACDKCQGGLTASLDCDSTNPASFTMHLTFFSPAVGTSYVIGTSLGGVAPFSGISGSGWTTPATLTFTTLSPSPLPDSVTVEVYLTYPTGEKCFEKIKIPVPSCHWKAERTNGNTVEPHPVDDVKIQVSSAMLVYPNPASGDVTVSYDYGSEGMSGRVLAIYDAMGRRMDYTTPLDAHGNWQLNTSAWKPGVYIVRMEGDGKALQVQRMVIVQH
jgi:uncharacterized protein YjdB